MIDRGKVRQELSAVPGMPVHLYPDQDPKSDPSLMVAGMRAYSALRLAHEMTARCLAQREQARAGARQVFVDDPGLSLTAAFRHHGAFALTEPSQRIGSNPV